METLLLTGTSGFLGGIIKPLLDTRYDVTSLGRCPSNIIQTDLASEIPLLQKHFDVVLHTAGKAHVEAKSQEEKQAFFDVNYGGTMHLCEALEQVGVPKSFVFVSSVSVYGCEEGGEFIDESHALNGKSSYARSKIMAEMFLMEWCKKHNVILTILRPSLIAGKDAPGNLGSMVRGIHKGYYVNIGGVQTRKSILMAEDIARLLPLVEDKGGVYNVCDTNHPTIEQLSCLIANQLGRRSPITIPFRLVWCMAKIGDIIGRFAPINSYKLNRLTKSLTFSNKKARTELGWVPLDVLENYIIK